jgi:hypothetical protein
MLAFLMALSFGSSGVTVTAQSAPVQAYVWADQPAADSYTPNAAFQFNSTGEANTIVRTGTGAYTVSLPGTAPGQGNIQLTAAGGSAEGSGFVPGTVCKIDVWPAAGKEHEQFVVCFDAAGEPVDSAFHLYYTSGDVFLGERAAYLWANDPSVRSYTPDERYQFNSTGALNNISRFETGTYGVMLPGFAAHPGNIQVTPASGSTLGEIPAATCGVSTTGDAGNDTRGVTVICADTNGTPVDSAFTLQYVAATNGTSSLIWAEGAYAMVTHSSVTNLYEVGPLVRFNSTGAVDTIQRTDVGKYSITLMNVGQEGGNVQVSAWGTESTAVTCNIGNWGIAEGTAGLNFIVNVACYDNDGNAADSHLFVSYMVPVE